MDPTKKIYVLCVDGMEWEDIVIFLLNDEEAIEKSKKYPKARLERFDVSPKNGGYIPTYKYYLNGEMF